MTRQDKNNKQQQIIIQGLENFEVGHIVGTGTFGVVKLATHAITKKHVAMKILIKSKMEELKIPREKVQREIDNLRRCIAHPHLIKLYDVFHEDCDDTKSSSQTLLADGQVNDKDDDDNDVDNENVSSSLSYQHFGDVILVKEFADGGDLYDYMISKPNRRLSRIETRTFFQQIISGVEYLHYKKIAHRDLTLDNILLDHDKQNIKIADFGFSNQFQQLQGEETKMSTSCGSPNYAAPELISGKLYAGTKVDIWSCGVVLFGMNCGSLPFVEPTVPELFKKIKAGKFTIPKHVSNTYRHLIHRMIEVDTDKRITIPEIRVHPAFRKNLPCYLKQSPEQIETERKQHAIDNELVDEMLRLYNNNTRNSTAGATSNTNNGTSSSLSLPQTSQDVQKVSRDVVEEAATVIFAHDQKRQYSENELVSSSSQEKQPLASAVASSSEIVLRDLSLNYKIFAALKEDATHKLTRKKQSCSFLGTIYGMVGSGVAALVLLITIVIVQASYGLVQLQDNATIMQ